VDALVRGVSIATQVMSCSEEGAEGYNQATFLALEHVTNDFIAKAQTAFERCTLHPKWYQIFNYLVLLKNAGVHNKSASTDASIVPHPDGHPKSHEFLAAAALRVHSEDVLDFDNCYDTDFKAAHQQCLTLVMERMETILPPDHRLMFFLCEPAPQENDTPDDFITVTDHKDTEHSVTGGTLCAICLFHTVNTTSQCGHTTCWTCAVILTMEARNATPVDGI
jgi:hypothetical protein